MENLDFYRQSTLPHLHRNKNDPLDIPKMIGPYKIDSILHKGTMSLLFLANHPNSTTPIAIKILSPQLASEQEMVDQFLEEARIIGLTEHPNIVKLYGQGEWEKGLYIAMEFIQGVSLKQFLMGGSLSLRRCLDIVLQVAYALLHLHTHGVIHRDLKPENILIQENGQIKVIDFGIAQVTLDPPATKVMGGIMGTPSYMSPEQRKNPRAVSFNTDIYSLGVIAYELILGKLSFGSIQLQFLPEHLQKIIQKALMPNPKDRYQDMVDLITDISTYLKTNMLEKDQNGEDQLKEALDTLGQQQQKLLPQNTPSWPEIEFGLARPKDVYLFGIYYDFFRLPDNSFVVVIAESPNRAFSAVSSIATLRGIVRSLMHQYLYPIKEVPFITSTFAEKLNQIFFDEPHDQNEALTILHLSPLLNELSFVSSGFDSIIHLNRNGGRPKVLRNNSPLLGQTPTTNFSSTTDNWNPGDSLILHTFDSPSLPFEQKKSLEAHILQSISSIGKTSPLSFSQSLLERLQSASPGNPEKVVLVLNRL